MESAGGHSSGYDSGLSQTLLNDSRLASPLQNQTVGSFSEVYRRSRLVFGFVGAEVWQNYTRVFRTFVGIMELSLFPIFRDSEEIELRPMHYIAPDEGGKIYADNACQTDPDNLTEHIKVVKLWLYY